ncbi:MAG: ribonuclease J [Minisyncoccales bacterium]
MKEKNYLKIIFLGGLGEVGMNMMALEWKEKILLIDAGLKMPDDDMPGIDYIIPNVEYLKNKKENILGIVFTHGHYDHIGALPYILPLLWHPKMNFFASSLTKGIILKRQEEFKELPRISIREVKDRERIKTGPFLIEFFKQNHNIPDNFGLFIETPVGNLIHTSDFKFDLDPVYDQPTNFSYLEELGRRGVLLLMSDSTDAEEEGHSFSEKEIMENLEKIFQSAKGRIFAATFASLINRLQQIITLSEKYKRKVLVEGHTMKINIQMAKFLGYLKVKRNTLISFKEMEGLPDSKITILCTGSQGESEAVLMRVAHKQHRFLKIKKGDTIIFSSSVIPGNEKTIQNMKDGFLRQGAEIFHYKMMDIHAGGHAKKEELKKMIEMIKPKFFLPIHGQFSMLVAHKKIALSAGIEEERIALAEDGDVLSLQKDHFFIEKNKVPCNYVMVDGLGVGDVGDVVLRDRKVLSQDGIFVIIAVIDKQTGMVRTSPDIISRGFVYLRESKELLREVRKKLISIIHHSTLSGKVVNFTYLKLEIRNQLGEFLFQKTKRRPIILPVLIEV